MVGGVAAAASFGIAACGTDGSGGSSPSSSSSSSPQATDPVSIATDAYVYGYPLVIMDATRELGAPANHFDFARRLPDAADRSIVRPNRDTLYAKAWLDLRAEPVVIQVPEVERGRYWLLQGMDAWTNVTSNPSSVRPGTTGPGPHTYVYTQPGWSGKLPDGAVRLTQPTPQGWMLGRVQVHGDADVAGAHAVQDAMKIAPLSAWLREPGTTNPPAQPGTREEAVAKVQKMSGTEFFTKLCQLMGENPEVAADRPALERFASVGITRGALKNTDAGVLDSAAKAGLGLVSSYQGPGAVSQNGWVTNRPLGVYGTDYRQRGFIARVGLGANVPEDSVYPTFRGSAEANTPGQSFRVTFAPGQLPPAESFWSLTAYGADSFLVPNPQRAYSVGNETTVVPAADGSVELVAQAAEPGPEVPRANWVAIPASGAFNLTLRMYSPKPEVENGTWKPPKVTTAHP